MAKRKKRGVNVSQLVRDYKSQHKRSKPKDIAAAISAQGTKISPQYVSTVLSNWRRKKGRKAKRAPAASSNGSGIDVAQLVKAKVLVEKLGGVEQAKKMVDALAKILG
jgi:hypothetical protein